MNCLKCRSPFLWNKRKQYCSDKCANDAAAARASKSSLAMMELPVAQLTAVMLEDLRQSDPPEALFLLLNQAAPAGAVGYRLGCTQPVGGGKYPCIRWFPPSVSKRIPIYKLDPLEPPSVPIPWDYVVAYFDAQHRLIGQPSIRVSIPYFNPKLSWSTGDRNLKVGPPEPEQF
jgi:hypothetical protein